MENKSIENSKHIKKVYTEKAINLLKIYIVIAIISGISYLIGMFIYSSFDFGLIFEILSAKYNIPIEIRTLIITYKICFIVNCIYAVFEFLIYASFESIISKVQDLPSITLAVSE